MTELDIAIVKEQVAEIRNDVKTIIDSLGVIDHRYHEMNLKVGKELPRIDDNKKRLDRLEPIVFVVAAIPVVLSGTWALVRAVMELMPYLVPK